MCRAAAVSPVEPLFAVRWTLIALLLIAGIGAPALAAPPSVDQILAQMVERYGGAAALVKLSGPYRQVWNLTAPVRHETGSEERRVALPETVVSTLTYPSSSETRILHGDEGEKIYNGTRRVPATGPALAAMRLQRMRLYNPLLLQERAAEMEADYDEPGYYRLGLREGALAAVYYVNRDSLLIDKVVGALSMGPGKMFFTTEYYDYEEIEGVMLPHREVKYAGDTNMAVLTLRETHFGE